jgi:uncharacterized OsmC-like protein
MNRMKVESQWNGTDEMILNVPYFPHLHSSLNGELNKGNRYPHPYEYFLAALTGIITLTVKNFAEKECLLITNLYITIEGLLNNGRDKIKEIKIDIHLDSSASPEELTILENRLTDENTLFSFLKTDKIHINWN